MKIINVLILLTMVLMLLFLWKGDDLSFYLYSDQYNIILYDNNGHIINEYKGIYNISNEYGMIRVEDRRGHKTYLHGSVSIETKRR